MFFIIFTFFSILLTILSVPFLIYFERRVLGILQLRYGLFIYFLNAFFIFVADFLKLLSKFNVFVFTMNYVFFLFTAIIFVILSVIILLIFPVLNFKYYLFFFYPFFFLIVFSFVPFPFSVLIYFSNSVYSFYGNIRSILLLISYEIIFNFCFILIILCFLLFFFIYSLYNLYFLFFIIFIFYICLLADSSRVPFDFIEGESELVSGFSTELSLVVFLLIFFGEYILLFFFILLISFCSNSSFIYFLFLFIFLRALLVRYFFTFILYLFWFIYLFFLSFFSLILFFIIY